MKSLFTSAFVFAMLPERGTLEVTWSKQKNPDGREIVVISGSHVDLGTVFIANVLIPDKK